jgi:hypothetical protein
MEHKSQIEQVVASFPGQVPHYSIPAEKLESVFVRRENAVTTGEQVSSESPIIEALLLASLAHSHNGQGSLYFLSVVGVGYRASHPTLGRATVESV